MIDLPSLFFFFQGKKGEGDIEVDIPPQNNRPAISFEMGILVVIVSPFEICPFQKFQKGCILQTMTVDSSTC